MAVSIGKMAPTAIFVAAVGYFCWPYLSPTDANAILDEAGQPVDINVALLAPKITAAPGRDPFGIKVEVPPESEDQKAELEENPEEKSDDKSEESTSATKMVEVTPTEPNGQPDKPANPDHTPPAVAEAPIAAVQEPLDLSLTGLALNATFLRGSRRSAMINSQFYSEGETLEPSGPNVLPFVVAKIFQHHVLLECQGQTVELTYPAPPPNPDLEPTESVAKGGQKAPLPKTSRKAT